MTDKEISVSTVKDERVISECNVLDTWNQHWQNNDIPWHISDVHDFIQKYHDDITVKRENLRFFLPLCGKSVDMKWLADKGHQVVGVEVSNLAIQDFFKEHEMKYTIKDVNDETKLYTNEDKNIFIYACDFFKTNAELIGGAMDAIWDRGSLVAINKTDREQYIDVIKGLLKFDGRILLSVFNYDETKYAGPPPCFAKDQVEKLFGKDFESKLLEDKDIFQPEVHASWGDITELHELALLIKRKEQKQ